MNGLRKKRITIPNIAEEIAAEFWDQSTNAFDQNERTQRFRETYPTLWIYLMGLQRCLPNFSPEMVDGQPIGPYVRLEANGVLMDGWFKQGALPWESFVEMAHERAAAKLRDNSLSDKEKMKYHNAIVRYAALVAENYPATKTMLQARRPGKTQIN